jgi:hypothetical protein
MKRALAILGTAVLAVTLSGCITVQLPAKDDDDRDPAPQSSQASPQQAEDVVQCGAEDVLLNQANTTYTLEGDCEEVSIQGTDITLLAENIDELTINGDRNTVKAQVLDEVEVSGQENTVAATGLREVSISGDRNTVDAGGDIDEVEVGGSDNVVSAEGSIRQVEDNGQRNTIG